MSGAERIAAERQRQIDAEGWSPEHDDGHVDESLLYVAAWLAAPACARHFVDLSRDRDAPASYSYVRLNQPGWKITTRGKVDRLVKAGALIAAEIDRLERAEPAA